LTEAKKRGLAGKDIEIRMDSELIVRQMTNEYQIKEETLWPQYMKVHNLLVTHFLPAASRGSAAQAGPNVKFTHVPRAENKEADKLVNEAIDFVVRGQ
jgi:ribonuclease HI